MEHLGAVRDALMHHKVCWSTTIFLLDPDWCLASFLTSAKQDNHIINNVSFNRLCIAWQGVVVIDNVVAREWRWNSVSVDLLPPVTGVRT